MRCHHKYAHYISVKLGGAQWLDEPRLRQLSAFAGWFSTYLSCIVPKFSPRRAAGYWAMPIPDDIAHGSGAQDLGPPSHNPQHAQPEQHKPQLTSWVPRSGRGEKYTRWETSRQAAIKQHKLHLIADQKPPDLASIKAILPKASAAVLEKKYYEALDEYQRHNTRYFDLVRPSLDIYADKRNWEDDHAAIEAFSIVTPDGRILSDGNALVAWAQNFADVSSLAKQGDLRLRLAGTKLGKGATVI